MMRLLTNLQSQRDCITQPWVARDELPWENCGKIISTPTGLHPSETNDQCCNPVGVVDFFFSSPRVARASQPWANRWNPVGIHSLPRSPNIMIPNPPFWLGTTAAPAVVRCALAPNLLTKDALKIFPRFPMPTTRASSAALEMGALPISTSFRRLVLSPQIL